MQTKTQQETVQRFAIETRHKGCRTWTHQDTVRGLDAACERAEELEYGTLRVRIVPLS